MQLLDLAYRLFCSVVLAFFAYAPLFVCYHLLQTVVSEPAKLDLTLVLIFCVSAAIAYFLLLLTYRAATGRGRKADGGLLPPVVMTCFVALFGVIAIAIVGMGVWQRDPDPIVGGLSYIGVVAGLWRKRRSNLTTRLGTAAGTSRGPHAVPDHHSDTAPCSVREPAAPLKH